jgi:hypothetical protein
MRTLGELKEALLNKDTIVWNDPDYIEGNDYRVVYVEPIDEEEFEWWYPILIHYNGGLSEAQVYLHELRVFE